MSKYILTLVENAKLPRFHDSMYMLALSVCKCEGACKQLAFIYNYLSIAMSQHKHQAKET